MGDRQRVKRQGNTLCYWASWLGFKSLPKCLCFSFSSARLLLPNAKLPAHRHTHTHTLVGKQRFNYSFPKLPLTFDPLKYFLKCSCRVADHSPFWSLMHTRKQTQHKVCPGSSCQQQSAVCPDSTLYSWSDDRNTLRKCFYKCWLRTLIISYTFPCMHAHASNTSEPPPLIINSYSGQYEYII